MPRLHTTLMSLILLESVCATCAAATSHAIVTRAGSEPVFAETTRIDKVENKIYTSSHSDREAKSFKAPVKRSDAVDLVSAFMESFEAWDGVSKTWIPDGWELQSANAEASWHLSGQVGDLRPTNGKYQMVCCGSTTQQEEMLISPEINVLSNHRVYADLTVSLYDLFDPSYFDTETKVFSKRVPTGTFIVKAYVDGFWNEIYNVASAAGRFSDQELYDFHRKKEKITLRLNLERFVGQNIRLAFIYKGTSGQDIALDYIAVQQINNMAVYRRPQGFFFIGIDEFFDVYNQETPWMIGPAYTDVAWNAYVTRDVEDIEWTFYNADNSTFTTSEATPVINNIYTVSWAPELMAISSGTQPVIYQFDAANKQNGAVAYGGDSSNPTTGKCYGFGNYNPSAGLQNPTYANASSKNVFGPTSNDEFWHGYNLHMYAIGNYYEKPLSPYWFDKVWISFADFDAEAEAEFKLTIYRVDGNVIDFERPIAEAKAYGRDAITSESGLGSLTFNFGKDYVTVSDAILMRIDGIFDNPKVRSFAPVCQNAQHIDGENTSYAFYIEDYNGKQENSLAVTSYLLNNFNFPFVLTFNGCYPFLHTEGNDNEFQAPAAGGEKSFAVNSLYEPEKWGVENLPDWVSEFQPDDDFVSDEGVIKCNLLIGVDPLPKDVAGRYAKVILTAPGIRYPFIISQGDPAGISSASSDKSKARLSVSGCVATLHVPAGVSHATVFSVYGQKVAEATIAESQTEFTLPAPGAYVVHLDNGESLKIVY